MSTNKRFQKHRRVTAKIFFFLVAFLIIGAGLLLILVTSLKPTPPEISQNSSDWPTANQNYANTRSAVGSNISSQSVSKLGLVWSTPIEGVSEWGAAATNPVILGNTVYFQDLKSNVYAVDFVSGKKLWVKKYNLDIAGPSGVAVGYGKIFAVKGHFEVVALDLNGNEIWSANLSNNQNVGIDIQPLVYNNLVYVSTVPGVSNENFYKGGSTGILYALDQKTGKVSWSFDTVDSKNIWGNPKVNSGGGAWYPPAIDVSSNNIFWGIGNPAPWPGTAEFPNGSSRPGPNLYTNSLLSLEASRGNLQWYNQVKSHDLFDYDLQVSPILATVNINKIPVDIVIAGGKMGRVVAFDRTSGTQIWNTPVGTHLNDDLTTLPPGTTKVSPGPLGGIETNMAYADGIVFVPIVNMTVEYTPSSFVATSFNIGTGKGQLSALDASTGKILWEQNFDSLNVGAATVVNDLVFTSTFNGKIYAFTAKTGKLVWQYQAPGGINGWPAVKGDTIVFPVGLGKIPSLLAFKLGGNLTPTTGGPLPVGGTGKEFAQ